MMLRYANIIFDLDRAAALKTVHGYLDDLGIAYCGRYGDWGYSGRTKVSRAARGPPTGRCPRRRLARLMVSN